MNVLLEPFTGLTPLLDLIFEQHVTELQLRSFIESLSLDAVSVLIITQ